MTKKDLVEKAKAMISAPSCCAELKEIGQAWIDSVGKSDEKEKAENLIAEIKEDITTVEDLVPFAGQKKFAAHADDLKASGAKYCDCGACKPALEILENKSVILG